MLSDERPQLLGSLSYNEDNEDSADKADNADNDETTFLNSKS